MRQPSSFIAWTWYLVAFLALCFLVWNDSRRIDRIDHIAAVTRGESVVSPDSPTGYAGGIRERVLPDHDSRAYEWIAQTQRMLATGERKIRRVEDENAPLGHVTYAPSAYRWWLALVAKIERGRVAQPIGLAVERAGIYADPVLHGLIVLSLTVFAAWYSGAFAAGLIALAAVFCFPFAARFFPGVPDSAVLEVVCTLGSLLPLFPSLNVVVASAVDRRAGDGSSPLQRPAVTGFVVAGVFGGLGFWINPASQTALTFGIALGGFVAAMLRVPTSGDGGGHLPYLWRVWSLSGALTLVVAYLFEYYPAYLGEWELRAVHPLYALAWIGVGELLARVSALRQGGAPWTRSASVMSALGLLAVVALPVAMRVTHNPGFRAVDPMFYRLVNQPGGAMAPNLVAWIRDSGLTLTVWATLLPTLVLVPAVGFLLRSRSEPAARAAIALALGAALLIGAMACGQIRQWLLLDTVMLSLLVVTTGVFVSQRRRPLGRGFWGVAVVVLLLPGGLLLRPTKDAVSSSVMSVPEAVGLVERDLAHGLAKRGVGGLPPLVLAPPRLTTSLNYYGGLRGIGTLWWENQDGLSFAIRTAISTSRPETAALLRQRGVTHIVLPSWDPFFDGYVQAASVQVGELFYTSLQRWNLPPWLKPVPFQLPSIPGFEKQSVKIFEVVEDQEPPVAAARLTEYFIDMGLLENAKASHQALLKYPGDLGVQVTRAQLWASVGDADQFTQAFEPLLSRLAAGADRYLPWDRRVVLATVLAQGNRMDLARSQVQRCLAEITEARLRSLTPQALFRLLSLNKVLGFEIRDRKLRDLGVDLLPTELRQQL